MRYALFLPFLCLLAGCADVSADPKKDPEAYVRNHPWWSKPLTSDQLNEVVKRITDANFGTEIWMNRKAEVVKWDADKATLCVEVRGEKRWDRARALAELVKQLDDCEFHHGPGRK